MVSEKGKFSASPDERHSAFRTQDGTGPRANLKGLLEELATDDGRLRHLDLNAPLSDLLQLNIVSTPEETAGGTL